MKKIEKYIKKFKVHKEPLKDNLAQKYVMFKYIDYKLNRNANVFQELFLYQKPQSESHFKRCF